MIKNPRKVLYEYWGYDSFRPLQGEIIHEVLDGNDVLSLMPTGGGKSICFQVPALCLDGVCIVISPLIALMKDQVENLRKRGIKAAAIFSGMNAREIDITFDNCIHGNIKLLYVSPERIKTEIAINRIPKMNVNLIAVDEAHCISQWGHDFRPAYLEISHLRLLLPKTPVLALTATATPDVAEDIQTQLLFKKSNILKKSFNRGNLAYIVLQEDDKLSKLEHILRKVGGSSIVYAKTRKLTVEIAKHLRQRGISTESYHAGLSLEKRSIAQNKWVKGDIRVMVATNAFGMGIDKPDVRTVIHLHLPDSLESYFQEAGRAGRDEKKAYAILLYNNEDKKALRRNLEVNFPELKEIRKVYEALGSYFRLAVGSGEGSTFDFDLSNFSTNFRLSPLNVHACLNVLEKDGWISLSEAYYFPSTIKILVSREQLYDFQLRNPAFDPLIKTLLRTLSGAFSQFVKLDERQIAYLLKSSETKIIDMLGHISKLQLVEYRPVKELPQITFLKPRCSTNNFAIDQQSYLQRKQRYEDRIKIAIKYAEEQECRNVQLLGYFGEESTPCGICDICLSALNKTLSAQEFERYAAKIFKLLKKEPMTEKEILESFASNRHGNVLKTLEYLLDEGKVDKYNGKMVISRKDNDNYSTRQ